MLKEIVKIYWKSDFSVQIPLPNGYNGQTLHIKLYTNEDEDKAWEASYMDGNYVNCDIDLTNNIATVFVDTTHTMEPGCITVETEYIVIDTNFSDAFENIKDRYKTNIYLVTEMTNASSAMFVPTNLPDLSGAIDFVTLDYLNEQDYITQSDLNELNYVTQSQISNFVTIGDLDTDGFVTTNDIADMNFVTRDVLGDTLASYVTTQQLNSRNYATNTALNSKQDTLVSGTNIKTINGSSLLGSGDIEIGIDQTQYVTKTQLGQMSYVTKSDLSDYVKSSSLSNVARTGNYNDLTNKPTFSTVATSGNYNDLTNRPTIPAAQIQSNWTQTDTSAKDYIKNKPDLSTKQDTLVSGTNLKTINNISLLGSGNIQITTGSGSSIAEVTQAQYDAMEQAGTLDPDIIYIITDAQSQDLSDYVQFTDLSTVATSGNYNDLTNKPDLSNYMTASQLSTVATSGNYNDLTNKPTLSTVATSGDYNDLINKPSIAGEQLQSDWAQTDTTAKDYIKNKPTIPAAQIQSNWTQTNTTAKDYIKNKPDLSNYATNSSLSSKQDTLVSGTNIKTINGSSILGSGNLTISGSGGDTNVIETIAVNNVNQTVTNKRVNITVPTNTNQLTNGAGFLTSAIFNYNSSTHVLTITT